MLWSISTTARKFFVLESGIDYWTEGPNANCDKAVWVSYKIIEAWEIINAEKVVLHVHLSSDMIESSHEDKWLLSCYL